jgi:hypothetical protein
MPGVEVSAENMEHEIASLREQVSQLQQQQEGWKTQWLRWSRIAGGVAITLLAADVFNRVAMHMPYADPPPIFFVMVLLTLAFGSFARPANISMNAHLRNFVLWVIIVISLVALFTLLQFRGWL